MPTDREHGAGGHAHWAGDRLHGDVVAAAGGEHSDLVDQVLDLRADKVAAGLDEPTQTAVRSWLRA